MSTAPSTPTLAQAVRTKYPGVYDDMDDVTLEQKVLAKYPQYADMPRTQAQVSPPGVPRPSLMGQPGTSAGSTMQQSLLGKQDNSDPDLQRLNRGIQAGNTGPMPVDAFAGAAVAGAPLAGAAALPFIAKQAAQHPIIAGMVGSELIKQARNIPYVGKMIPPGAEWLPFLLSKHAPEGAAPIERDATEQNSPFAGEEEAAPAAPKQQTQLPWTPAQPTTQWPKPGSKEDLAETQQIQEQVRNTADAENQALLRLGNQERYARSSKGELTGSENAPVTLTKTPSANTIKPRVGNSPPAKAPYYLSGGAKTTGNAPQGQSEDLTDILQKSLDAVKKRKGQQ